MCSLFQLHISHPPPSSAWKVSLLTVVNNWHCYMTRSIIIIPAFLPLSTNSQGGDREFIWLGSPLTYVLPMWSWGQRTWDSSDRLFCNFFLNQHLISTLFKICSLHIQHLQSLVLTALLMRPALPPQLFGSPYIWMVLSSCFLWKSSQKMRLSS